MIKKRVFDDIGKYYSEIFSDCSICLPFSRRHTHTHTCVCACVCLCIIYIYLYICVCARVYICIYIPHTHTHTHSHMYLNIFGMTKNSEDVILTEKHVTLIFQYLFSHTHTHTHAHTHIYIYRSRDELISDIFLWTSSHGRAKAGRPARTYIQWGYGVLPWGPTGSDER